MKKGIIAAALLSSMSGIALAQTTDPAGQYFNRVNPPLTPQERAGLAISQDYLDHSATGSAPVAGAEGSVVFLFGANEPTIVCAVLQVCDVELQPGEQINSVNVGDSARWMIEPAVSRGGTDEIEHLIVKPMDVGLNTSLVVTTDRRTYHIRLVSHRTQFMPRVSFSYPDEVAAKWAALKAHNEKVRDEAMLPNPEGRADPGNGRPAAEYLGNLHFGYRVKGKARWKPLRVFNDGVKTIIEMPKDMERTEAPSLLVVRKGGNIKNEKDTNLVNYRVQDDRYVVDQVFDEAVLIAGVGKRQERVTIEREL